jgi:hypothetical protein
LNVPREQTFFAELFSKKRPLIYAAWPHLAARALIARRAAPSRINGTQNSAAAAARAVNQTLPPRPAVSLPERYREIFAPLLRGVIE